jgi:hypothetical protein
MVSIISLGGERRLEASHVLKAEKSGYDKIKSEIIENYYQDYELIALKPV